MIICKLILYILLPFEFIVYFFILIKQIDISNYVQMSFMLLIPNHRVLLTFRFSCLLLFSCFDSILLRQNYALLSKYTSKLCNPIGRMTLYIFINILKVDIGHLRSTTLTPPIHFQNLRKHNFHCMIKSYISC